MATPKELGNAAFKAQDYTKAVEHYTEAIAATPGDHTIYGNRSASYHNLKKYNEALADGAKCVDINPAWAKGYLR
jgi:stress-induced-phosphoprotein 1